VSRGDGLAPYLKEAAAWDADLAAQARRSARIAWTVAGAGWVCTGMVATALMLLMPLKRVDPFVIRVSDTTGVVDVVPTYVGKTELPESVTRYFLTHYVMTCERFNFSTAESDYEECGAFHNQAWYALWVQSNPASPLNVNKSGSSVRAQVSSVTFFTRASGVGDLAQVRYLKARRAPGAADEQLSYWIATIQYTYGSAASDPRTRRWNPLGLKIVDFRSEQEVGAEPQSAATPSRTAQAIP